MQITFSASQQGQAARQLRNFYSGDCLRKQERTDARTMKKTFWSELRELWALRRRCQQIKLQQRKGSLLRPVNSMPERSNLLKNFWPDMTRSQVTPPDKCRPAAWPATYCRPIV
jgi:hypothetical protein